MQRESVESAIAIQPAIPFQLDWSADDTSVSIVPTAHWAPSTYYTVDGRRGGPRDDGPADDPSRTVVIPDT